jgi:methylated-DNA-[protein]-cysteine S-methyltransferase
MGLIWAQTEISDRKEFNLPILMVGTEFQKSVWVSLMKVPYGATSTYLQLAKDINNEKAIRAVASANGANSIGLIIPCHRVIGSDGQLVGYGGGLSVKKQLLNMEQRNSFSEEAENRAHNNNMQPAQKSFAFSVG